MQQEGTLEILSTLKVTKVLSSTYCFKIRADLNVKTLAK